MHFKTYLGSSETLSLEVEWMDKSYIHHKTLIEIDLTPVDNVKELNVSVNHLKAITQTRSGELIITEVSQETGELIRR